MFRRRKPDEPGSSSAAPSPAPTTPATAPAADSGLGVPPFRPAAKELPAMGKSFTAPTQPQSPAQVGARAPMTGRAANPAERRTLVVGRGISLQGTVQDAERLVVEGTVEASMIHATELAIAQGGVFKGEVEVDDAEIAGTLDGTLTARGTLVLRATGKLMGTARCRRLQVEEGGQISGQMQMLPDTPAAPSANATPAGARPAPTLVQESAAE